MREPGIAYWPGRIAPGRVSAAVVATYDIFVTAVRLAGAQLPNLALDGRDLSPVLFNETHNVSPHDCVYHWRGAPGQGCPVGHMHIHIHIHTHVHMHVHIHMQVLPGKAAP